MELDTETIKQILPHRPPIRIIEELVDVEPPSRGTGRRLFEAESHFFAGHFPGKPILPGVYLIEAFAQTAMVVCLGASEKAMSGNGLLARVNEMKFYHPVTPGQTIRFRIEVERRVGAFVFVDCEAMNDDDIRVAEGRLTLKLD